MPQQPKVLGLMLCDKVVYDQKTQKPYLLGVFTGIPVEDFSKPARFDVFSALTDGQGDVTMSLRVFHLNDQLTADEEIYSQDMIVKFPDPLRVVNLAIAVRQLVFTKGPGTHLFALMAGNDEIAARRVRVYQVGGSP